MNNKSHILFLSSIFPFTARLASFETSLYNQIIYYHTATRLFLNEGVAAAAVEETKTSQDQPHWKNLIQTAKPSNVESNLFESNENFETHGSFSDVSSGSVDITAEFSVMMSDLIDTTDSAIFQDRTSLSEKVVMLTTRSICQNNHDFIICDVSNQHDGIICYNCNQFPRKIINFYGEDSPRRTMLTTKGVLSVTEKLISVVPVRIPVVTQWFQLEVGYRVIQIGEKYNASRYPLYHIELAAQMSVIEDIENAKFGDGSEREVGIVALAVVGTEEETFLQHIDPKNNRIDSYNSILTTKTTQESTINTESNPDWVRMFGILLFLSSTFFIASLCFIENIKIKKRNDSLGAKQASSKKEGIGNAGAGAGGLCTEEGVSEMLNAGIQQLNRGAVFV